MHEENTNEYLEEIDRPSNKRILFCQMETDSQRSLGAYHQPGHAFCCLCGRPFPIDDFSIEHIVPQRFLANDTTIIRDNFSKNTRSENILLCKEKLSIGGKNYLGCNNYKGSVYDGHIATFLSRYDGGIGTRDECTATAKKRPFKIQEIIGTMIMMYLAVYKKFGYKVVFSPSSVILRRQFFRPEFLLDSIAKRFFVPYVISDINGRSSFATQSLSEPFEIIDNSFLVNNRFFNLEGSRIHAEEYADYYSVRFRRIMMNVPISTIKQVPSSVPLILPGKYRFKPNFDAVF